MRFNPFQTGFFILALLASTHAFANETLNVLTYNLGLLRVHYQKIDFYDMVPLVQKREGIIPQGITDLVNANSPDIIAFQELWEDEVAEALVKALPNYNIYWTKDAQTSVVNSTGLMLAVRAPYKMVSTRFIHSKDVAIYERISGMHKGILTAKIMGPDGLIFDFVTVHTTTLDSHDGIAYKASQISTIHSQLDQMSEVISDLQKAEGQNVSPLLVCGDMNIGPGYVDEAFQRFHKEMGLTNVYLSLHPSDFEKSWDKENPLVKFGLFPSEPSALIDHCFTKDGAAAEWHPLDAGLVSRAPKTCDPALKLHDECVPLSDHYALHVKLGLDSK